jgi:hypothetical protein
MHRPEVRRRPPEQSRRSRPATPAPSDEAGRSPRLTRCRTAATGSERPASTTPPTAPRRAGAPRWMTQAHRDSRAEPTATRDCRAQVVLPTPAPPRLPRSTPTSPAARQAIASGDVTTSRPPFSRSTPISPAARRLIASGDVPTFSGSIRGRPPLPSEGRRTSTSAPIAHVLGSDHPPVVSERSRALRSPPTHPAGCPWMFHVEHRRTVHADRP